MELAEQQSRFRERGLGLAAISYDSQPILKAFAARREIPFPLLSDPSSQVIRAFDLLQPEYPEGHEWHGVPYPGMLIFDAQGILVEKHFEAGYRPRQTAASAFVHLGDPGANATRVDAEHFALTTSLSDPQPFPGNRLTLLLEFEMLEGHHAYAPGEHAYRALALRLKPHPLFELHQPVRPEPRPFRFAPLEETVPVYEGRFRILQDVTLAAGRPLAQALEANPELVLQGVVEFQVCSDRICYPPSQLPVSWLLRPRALVR